MSDQGPPSRWSSAREREERERQRAEALERAKRDRLAREAAGDPGTPPVDDSRRLSDDARRAIREPRFPPPAGPDPAGRVQPPPAGTTPAAEPAPTPSTSGSGIGTRWRDTAPPPPGGSLGGGLPDLPGDEGRPRRRGGNNRLIIFGLLLFALMATIPFLPFGPFGGDESPPLPTPSATLPSILGTVDDGPRPGDPAPEATPGADPGQAIVCIDAGHGGWDTGWSRTEEGSSPYAPPIVTEAELNLGMAWMLKEALEAEGIFVVMTRPSGAAVNMFDEDIDGDGVTRLDTDNPRHGARDELQARINICNEAGAHILISVHLNGFDDPSVRGHEVLYTAEREFGQQNADLATFVYRQLDAAMREVESAAPGRGYKADTELESQRHEFGAEQHLVMTGPAVNNPDYQIVPSAMPGIIVEAVFLSNDLDAAWIVQPANQRLVVEAYVRGIQDYLERHPPE